MKNKNIQKTILLWFIVAIFISCASTHSNTTHVYNRAYFTGSGGSGMRLAILVPQSSGLKEEQAYLPRMIQGTLVSNISKYSAISVLDKISLDKVIAETLDPVYEDNFDIVKLGHITQVGYMLTGDITRTSAGYNLRINVSDTTSNIKTIASYSTICTVAQLDDLSAIHKASENILNQMGIQLTSAAKSELGRASSSQTINAQTNLAKGIVAQQRGTLVEAMTYFQSAANYDPALTEASKRLSTISTNIRTGNIGANARNAIAARNAWIPILEESTNYFKHHLPIEIKYTSNLKQTAINYYSGTVNLEFSVSSYASNNIKIIQDILSGLKRTGKKKEWGFEKWPYWNSLLSTKVAFALVNESGRTISTSNVVLKNQMGFSRKLSGVGITEILGVTVGVGGTATAIANAEHLDEHLATGLVKFTASVLAADIIYFAFIKSAGFFTGDDWGIKSTTDNIYKIAIEGDKQTVAFEYVDANEITDKLTIKVLSVNGYNVEQAIQSGYVRIVSR
jgi:TolB-like protein